MKQQNEVPKVNTEIKKRTFEIKDDGTVIMKEEILNEVTMSYREFLSFYRQHDDAITNIEKQLGKEHQDLLKKELEKVQSRKEELKIPLENAETKAKKHHTKLRRESLLKKVKEELQKKKEERNVKFLNALIKNLEKEDASFIMDNLSEGEKNLLSKIKAV